MIHEKIEEVLQSAKEERSIIHYI